MLELALQCYGPITGENPQATSHAMGLCWYAERYPEFNALVHLTGMGAELKLPAPAPDALQRWATIKVTARLIPGKRSRKR
jgi:hypothetical protein